MLKLVVCSLALGALIILPTPCSAQFGGGGMGGGGMGGASMPAFKPVTIAPKITYAPIPGSDISSMSNHYGNFVRSNAAGSQPIQHRSSRRLGLGESSSSVSTTSPSTTPKPHRQEKIAQSPTLSNTQKQLATNYSRSMIPPPPSVRRHASTRQATSPPPPVLPHKRP